MNRSLLCVAVLVMLCAAATGRADLVIFDAKQKTASGPSYPTSPVTFDVATVQSHGPPIIPVENLGLSLFDAYIPGNPVMPLSMDVRASDNGSEGAFGTSAGSSYGTDGFVDFMHSGPPIFPAQSFFDVFVDLNRSSLHGPPIRIANGPPIIPGAGIGPPIFPSFDVLFDIAVEGLGTAHHQLHFAIGDMQPLLFSNVSVDRVVFDPSFHINFNLNDSGGALTGGPLYTMTATGSFTPVPEPGSLTLCGIGGLLLAAIRYRTGKTGKGSFWYRRGRTGSQ